MKYEKVWSDVRNRFKQIAEAKPSLAKFLRDHRNNPIESLHVLVTQELERQGYKFDCMSPYDFAHFSCDAVFGAFVLIAGGYGAISKFGKTAEATATIDATQSVRIASPKGATTVSPIEKPVAVALEPKIDPRVESTNLANGPRTTKSSSVTPTGHHDGLKDIITKQKTLFRSKGISSFWLDPDFGPSKRFLATHPNGRQFWNMAKNSESKSVVPDKRVFQKLDDASRKAIFEYSEDTYKVINKDLRTI